MSDAMTNLWVGYDLDLKFSQISCYNQRRKEVDSICLPGKRNAYEIPTVLCQDKNDETYLFGEEALAKKDDRNFIFIQNFLTDYEKRPKFYAGGRTYEKKELLYEFIQLSLGLIKRYYPHGHPEWITFTTRDLSDVLIRDLMEIGARLSVVQGQVLVQSHIASYECYAMCQPKELRMRDVGLFEYDERGLYYYHLQVNQRKAPAVVTSSKLNLTAYLSWSDHKNLTSQELDTRFQSVIKEVLGKRNVSTVYLVGSGFSDGWMDASLKTMCSNRKGFIGQNLYSRGACYHTMLEATGKKNQDFIAFSDEMIPVDVYVNLKKGRQIVREYLVKAGTDWFSAQGSLRVILDDTDEIHLHVKNFFTGLEKIIPLKLEQLPARPNRTTRVQISYLFTAVDICDITIEDLGFGSIFPSKDKVWKKHLNIVEYEGSLDRSTTGGLVYSRPVTEDVPYYFHISGIKVYSVEELCYYIHENIYSISLDTFSKDLLYWLEKDMNEPTLAAGIRSRIQAGETVAEVVSYFLNEVGYYSPQECKELVQIMNEMADQNPTEAKKLSADNLVRYCRYIEAIRIYSDVIYDMEHEAKDEVTADFKASTWHNLGVAYSRVLNFSSAQNCFRKAWQQNKSEESLKSLLFTCKILGDESGFFDAIDQSGLSQEKAEEISREFDRIQQDSLSGKNEHQKQVQEIYAEKTSEEYAQKRDAYLRSLKEWYRG